MGQALPRAAEVITIPLGKELRLAGIPKLLEKIAAASAGGTKRIELEATILQKITEGARLVLLSTTCRLAKAGIDLVLVERR